jgi:hypothetical protein
MEPLEISPVDIDATALLSIVEALAEIQAITIEPIVIPDESAMTENIIVAIMDAADLIRRRSVHGTWARCSMTVDKEGSDHAIGDRLSVVLDDLLTLELGDRTHSLGRRRQVVRDARIESTEPDGTGGLQINLVPGDTDVADIFFAPHA